MLLCCITRSSSRENQCSAQEVANKALNLVDVGSSPMVGVTSYDVIFNEVSTKCQLSIVLLSRPLGAIRCCSSLHDHIYKVPAHYCIMTRPLGATLVEVFMSIKAIISPRLLQAWQPGTWGLHMWNIQFWLVTEMNVLDFLKGCNIYIEATLKLSLCSPLKTWGLQVICI